MEVSEYQELTYKQLPDSVFIIMALVLQMGLVSVSIALVSVERVFAIVGSFIGGTLSFLLPAIFYIVAHCKFNNAQRC